MARSFGVRRHEADIEPLDGEHSDSKGKTEQNRCDKALPRKVRRALPLHSRHRVRIDDRRTDRQQPGEEAHDHEYRHEHVRRAEGLLAEHLPGDHAVGQHEDVLRDDHHRRGAEESDELAVGKCHATFTLSIIFCVLYHILPRDLPRKAPPRVPGASTNRRIKSSFRGVPFGQPAGPAAAAPADERADADDDHVDDHRPPQGRHGVVPVAHGEDERQPEEERRH